MRTIVNKAAVALASSGRMPSRFIPGPQLGGFADLARSVVARTRPARVPRSVAPSMSKCAIKYALAVSDPLNPAARAACVPYGSSESQKVHAIIRLDTQVGSNGVGAVLISPCTANDLPSVYYTTNAFAGFVADPLTPWLLSGSNVTPSVLATGWATAAHNGPYTATQLCQMGNTGLVPQISSRMVAMGARIQYTGTTLNESGMYTCYHDMSHSSVSGKTISQLQANANTLVEGTTRDPCTVRVYGVEEDEMNFVPIVAYSSATAGDTSLPQVKNLYPFSPSNQWQEKQNAAVADIDNVHITVPGTTAGAQGFRCAGAPIAAVTFTGVAGQTYHLEVVVHMEFLGQTPSAFYTPVTADPVATQMVRTAAAQLPARMQVRHKANGWDIMYEALKEGYSIAKPVLVPALQGALAAMVL